MFDTFTKGNWRIVDAIQRIWAGEHDREALTADIDYNSRAIVLAILAQLAATDSRAQPGSGGTSGAEDGPEQEGAEAAEAPEQQGITLEQLLDLVARACQPGAPAGLAEQLRDLTRGLASDAGTPAEYRALGHVLNAVLSGERALDLAGLPEDMARAVRGMIAGI